MFFEQIPCAKSSLAYLFGCAGQGMAIAVDVHAGDEEAVLRRAQARGAEIRYVIDTHIHADHVSGGRQLAALSGAEYALHESNQSLPFAFLPLADGQILHAGNVSLEVIHTPGHTPDSLSLLVRDHSRSDQPWFVLTGHTLFVGSVGRPDLHGRAEEMAHLLYDSIFGRLLALPDELEIFPGAQAGSVCGGGISGKPSSTIGFEKRFNTRLLGQRHQFVADVVATVLPDVEDMRSIIQANTSSATPTAAI